MVNNKDENEIDYLIVGPETNADIRTGVELKKAAHHKFKDAFTGIRCFSLQVIDTGKPYKSLYH